jgi:predicted dehydrogenase
MTELEISDPLHYIVVGLGGHGTAYCRGPLPRLFQLGKALPVAAVDTNPEALPVAQEALKLPPDRCYTEAAKAFAENEADFAIVLVPPAYHEEVVDLALEHDMDILSTKPIADTMEACCRIYRKVTDSEKKMVVAMSHRFDQDKQSLQRAAKSGGALNYVICRFTSNHRTFGSWGKFRHEMENPLLVEGAIHQLDILRALSGSNARTVYTTAWNPSWGEYAGDSTALITIEMENNVRCFYEGSKASASSMNSWGQDYFRVECESATFELDRRKLRVLKSKSGAPTGEEPEVTPLPLEEQKAWSLSWITEQFCDWLRGGPAPETTVDDAIQSAALLFAAIESAHSGTLVDVQAFLEKHLKGA